MSKINNNSQSDKFNRSTPYLSDNFMDNLVVLLVGLAVIVSVGQVFRVFEKYSFISLDVLLKGVLPRMVSWEFAGNLIMWAAFVLWCGTYLIWNRAAAKNTELKGNLDSLSYQKKLVFLLVKFGALLGLSFMAYFIFDLAGFTLAFAWFNSMQWGCLNLMRGKPGRVRIVTDSSEVLVNSFDFWLRYNYIYQILNFYILVLTGFFASLGPLKVVWGFLLVTRVVMEFRRNEQFYSGNIF